MAMRRSRGERSLTTRPPMRISPDVGASSPAIMRNRVVFPEPDGPRKTRNSPSRVSKLTLFTAPSAPSLKTFVRSRVSTTAIGPPVASFPACKNTLVFVLGGVRGILRRFVAASDFGEHRGNDPALEGLVDGGGCVSGIADVGGPIEDVAEDLVFVRGSGPRVVGNFLVQVRHGVRETGEIVELAGGKAVMERIDVVDQELLGTVLVLGEVPDDIAIHHVLGGDAAHRAAQRPRDHDLALNREVLALGLTRDGDGVRNVRDAPGEHGLVVGWWRPGEDLGCLRFLVQSLHVLQRSEE